MSSRKLIIIGAVLMFVSLALGFLGAAWGISSSFASLETAETMGIDAVGDGISTALLATIAGILGTFFGSGLLIFGAIRFRKA